MFEDRPPFHLGAPLGFGALAALVGATGYFLVSEKNTAPSVKIDTEQVGTVAPASAPPLVAPISSSQQHTLEAVEPDAVQTSAPDDTPQPAPHPPKASPPDLTPAATIPARAEGTEVTFIVRIKGSEEIDSAAKLYRKDKPAALEAYQAYLNATPALRDFQIIGASYSGEINISYQLAPGQAADRATINKLKSQIMSVNGVSYADPDFIAHPGKE